MVTFKTHKHRRRQVSHSPYLFNVGIKLPYWTQRMSWGSKQITYMERTLLPPERHTDVKHCCSDSYLITLLAPCSQYQHAKTFCQEQGKVYAARLSPCFLVELFMCNPHDCKPRCQHRARTCLLSPAALHWNDLQTRIRNSIARDYLILLILVIFS